MKRKIGFFPPTFSRSRILSNCHPRILFLLYRLGLISKIVGSVVWTRNWPTPCIQGRNWQLIGEGWGFTTFRDHSFACFQFGPLKLQTGMWTGDHCEDYEAI